MREYWSGYVGGVGWNPVFIRPFNDLEVEKAKRLLCGLGRYGFS